MHRAQCSTAVPHSCGSVHRAALCPSCAPRAPVLQPFPPSSRCRAPIPCGVDCRDDVSGFPGLALSPAPAVLRVGLCKLPVLKCTARRCVASCQVHEPSHNFLGQRWVLCWRWLRLLGACLVVLCAAAWLALIAQVLLGPKFMSDAQRGAGTEWSLSSLSSQAVPQWQALCCSFGWLSSGSFCSGCTAFVPWWFCAIAHRAVSWTFCETGCILQC